jgi:hypothetical protein
MTMGLTLRNTARRINRLKGVCVFIPSGYDSEFNLTKLDHRVPAALRKFDDSRVRLIS